MTRAEAKAHFNYKGRRKHPAEYVAWFHMKQRCYNSKVRNFKWYGAKGITVCERWISSFQNFFDDMGAKPSPKHSLDRINPFGNYEPENCRWATSVEQNNNRRIHHTTGDDKRSEP